MLESNARQEYLFNDFDEYAKFVRQADLEHSQLSSGSFSGSLVQLIHGPVIISHHKMNQKILQRGAGVNGYLTFLLPGNMQQDIIWRKSRLKGNVIGVLQGKMEHDCITPENFVGVPVSIENDYLIKLIHSLGYSKIIKYLKHKEVFTIDELKAQNLHKMVMKCLHNETNDLASEINNILLILIQSLYESVENDDSIQPIRINKMQIFSQARDFIHANSENTILVSDLCSNMGVSERSLRYAFERTAGLSPKKYINHCRLNKVRTDLKSGYFEKIIEVAHHYGFWHTGQFAADYLKLFGELPSSTFKSAG